MITTGMQIKTARAALSWTQDDLAARARMHVKTVAYWERCQTITARQHRPNSAPVRMLAAFQAAGVDIVSTPRPAVMLTEGGSNAG